ncbi:MAG: vanadium-dependent haloperoxidase, partial [Actinomycetota bacterium]
PPLPPSIGDPSAPSADDYRDQAIEVIRASADLAVGESDIDISPGAFGDNSLGVDDGDGRAVNPVTDAGYEPNVVDAADYYRAIAEYWADGPTSETPPGHWNSLANEVSDRLAADERRLGGVGEPLDRLAWDVHLGVVLNGALNDAAVTAWGTKAHFDTVRPITMIRWMSDNGPYDPIENPTGIPLEDGLVEVVTAASAAAGERHRHLVAHVGEIAVRAWRGSPDDPERQTAGVDWILGADWVPYQRSTFVSPAFASYVSGHSTFSRAAAEVLAGVTGSEYFPGGLATHEVPFGSFLHEEGPSATFELQWATYFDAADEAGRSRIWGGIHIEADDRVGRQLGSEVSAAALRRGFELFGRS